MNLRQVLIGINYNVLQRVDGVVFDGDFRGGETGDQSCQHLVVFLCLERFRYDDCFNANFFQAKVHFGQLITGIHSDLQQ